jgi:ribosomal-protein-alanine N-acetyltransferase
MERDANHRRIALVAENAHREVLGFAIASLISPQAELETLVVAAEAQGRGIGRALLSRLLAAMKTFSITEVTIEVRPSNHSALSLYRSFGFIQVGRRSLYYADPAEDALVLTARIEAGASGGP